MKRILIAVAAIVLALFVLGCGDWGVDTGSTSTPTPAPEHTHF